MEKLQKKKLSKHFRKSLLNSLCFLFLIVVSANSYAQLDSLVMSNYQKAVELVETGHYHEANKAFLTVLNPNKTMPDEICYFFAVSLYQTNYVDQSEELLIKYLELTADEGNYFEEATTLLRLIRSNRTTIVEDSAVIEEEIPNPKTATYNKETKCKPGDKVICPICKGSGVIVSEGSFGNYYRPCPYSDEQGLMSCENYNEYLRGNLIKYKGKKDK